MIHEWLGIPAALIAFGFAAYVFVVTPGTLASRLLVAMLITDGIAVITSYWIPDTISGWFGMEVDFLWARVHQASDYAVVGIYLPFLGATLNSPLVAPLKGEKTRIACLTIGGILALAMFVIPVPLFEYVGPIFYVMMCVALAWGFIAATHSWLTATSEAMRSRARAFTFAFGLRDVLWTFTFAMTAAREFGTVAEGPPWDYVIPTLYSLALILYVPLVAYGILRTQLFDIDLRLKRTLKRSTVGALFLATFFLVSELAASVLSEQFGTVLGLIGAAALVFFIAPIQRVAEKLSDAAMPGTQATPEYETYRKLQVYESAVQAALDEGGISARERRMLESLIASLGIDRGAAERLESDARAAAGAV